MATNDEMDVRSRTSKTSRTHSTARTVPHKKEPSYKAAVPLLATIGTSAAAGAATGPAAPLAIPILATTGAGVAAYQNRDKIGTFVRATIPVAKNYVTRLSNQARDWFNSLTADEEAEVEAAHEAAAQQQDEQEQEVVPTIIIGSGDSGNEPENDQEDNKPGKMKRLGQWVKKHPWKATGVGIGVATAAYPTRKYIVGPLSNYALPMLGNAGSWFVSGETPFNIPAVANDSTDLWYKGSVGKVKTSPRDTTFTQERTVPTPTVMISPTIYRQGVNTDSILSILEGKQ